MNIYLLSKVIRRLLRLPDIRLRQIIREKKELERSRERSREQSRKITTSNHVNLVYYFLLLSALFEAFVISPHSILYYPASPLSSVY